MLGTTIAAAIFQTFHVRRVDKFKAQEVSGNVVLYSMVGCHFFQFLAVCIQLFGNKDLRKRVTLMARVQ